MNKVCEKCKASCGSREGIRCYGSCNRIFHPSCIDWNFEKFIKLFKDCPYAKFVCLECQEENSEKNQDSMKNLQEQIQEIKELVSQNSKNNLDKVNSHDQMLKDMHDAINKIGSNIEDKNECITKEINKVATLQNKNMESYAKSLKTGFAAIQMTPVKQNHKQQQEMIKTPNPILIVKSKNAEQVATTTEEFIKDKIDPTKVPISNLRKKANGTITMECNNENIENVRAQTEAALGCDYEVKIPQKFKPRIKAIGIHTEFTPDEMKKYIYSQNPVVTQNSYVEVIQIRETRLKNGFTAIIELDAKTYSDILSIGKLNIEWDRCSIFENINIRRCFNCSGYFHRFERCSDTKACSRCSEEHDLRDCKSSIDACINCKKANEKLNLNLDTNHPAWSEECEVYKRNAASKMRSIEYNK